MSFEPLDELTPALKVMIRAKFLDKGLSKTAMQVRSQAKKNVMRKKYNGLVISNTGDLAKSINSKKVKVHFYRITVTEPYGVYVHEGTRPHFPPFSPISKWVAKKLKKPKNPANYLITRAIQKNIAKYGTKAKPFLKDAMEAEATEKKITERIQVELIKELSGSKEW